MSIEITSQNITKFNKRLHQAIQKFESAGKTHSLSSSAELFSQALGFKTYHDLQSHLKDAPSSTPGIVQHLTIDKSFPLSQSKLTLDHSIIALEWVNGLHEIITKHHLKDHVTGIMEWRWMDLDRGPTLEAIYDNAQDFVHFGLNPSQQIYSLKKTSSTAAEKTLFQGITQHLEKLFELPFYDHYLQSFIRKHLLPDGKPYNVYRKTKPHFFFDQDYNPDKKVQYALHMSQGYLQRSYLVLDAEAAQFSSSQSGMIHNTGYLRRKAYLVLDSLQELTAEILHYSNIPLGKDLLILEYLHSPGSCLSYEDSLNFGQSSYYGKIEADQRTLQMYGMHGEKLPYKRNIETDDLSSLHILIQGYMAGVHHHNVSPYGWNEDSFDVWEQGYDMGSRGRFIHKPSEKKKPAIHLVSALKASPDRHKIL